MYSEEIQKLLNVCGYGVPVEAESDERDSGKIWYLPHHNVVNVNKPGKLRVVFDCAAEYDCVSSNKRVLQGPDLTNRLIGVITRFRQERVAVMSNIEATFHQVRVTPDDRDVLRFLWWPDGNLDKPPGTYRMTVHLFGGVWSPSCATYALCRTAKDHEGEFSSVITSSVSDSFYVDDFLRSLSTADRAMLKQLCELLSKGGFRLTKWTSNSREVLSAIPVDERASDERDLNIDEGLPVKRALAVRWNTQDDKLGIKFESVKIMDTRRGVLSTLSSVYDPLGIVCPFVLHAKLIFQNECRLSKG